MQVTIIDDNEKTFTQTLIWFGVLFCLEPRRQEEKTENLNGP